MVAMTLKLNFECIIQYYADQWRVPAVDPSRASLGTPVRLRFACQPIAAAGITVMK